MGDSAYGINLNVCISTSYTTVSFTVKHIYIFVYGFFSLHDRLSKEKSMETWQQKPTYRSQLRWWSDMGGQTRTRQAGQWQKPTGKVSATYTQRHEWKQVRKATHHNRCAEVGTHRVNLVDRWVMTCDWHSGGSPTLSQKSELSIFSYLVATKIVLLSPISSLCEHHVCADVCKFAFHHHVLVLSCSEKNKIFVMT